MAPQDVRFFEGRKFMWDGEAYPSRDAAEAKRKEYTDNRFETQLIEEDGAFLVYTRRVVTEVVVEGDGLPIAGDGRPA
ncbi:MAG: hypothetical protein FJ290_00100 [Planctomycetes bacterium]|nr:hypothetical protein [Planctomycetota bacterium]